MEYKAVIFDLDGTLLDTLEDLTNAVNYALLQLGFKQRTKEEIKGFVGDGIKKLIERSLPNINNLEIIEKGLVYFKQYYENHCMDFTKPYDGIMNMLILLQSKNIKLAIVSNKADFAVKKLKDHFFKDINMLTIGESESIKRKPCPDSLLKVVEDLKLNVNDCVYVGDSDIDIKTSINANMDCISVSWGFRNYLYLEQHGAVKIVSNTNELLQQIIK